MDNNESSTNYRLKFDPNVIGSTGLRQTGGYLYEEVLKDLRGLRGATTFREMADNDPIVGAVLFAITMLIRQCKWTVQAADDTGESESAQAFVEEVIADMNTPLSSIVGEACSMFTYGYAPMEIVWKRRSGPKADARFSSKHTDGKIGIRAIALRAQTSIVRWLIDEGDGTIHGLVQQPIGGGMVTIPIEKMCLFRTTDERNNPEGRSILRNAYRPWMFKKRIEEIEGIGIERDLAGLPIARIPSQYFDASADSTEKATLAAWKKLVTSVRRDQQEGLLLPSDRDQSGNLLFDFQLLNAGGSRTFDTTKVIDRYNRAIATSVLADFIFLGQQSVGSFALSSDKTALFATALGAYLKMMGDVLNTVIDRLWVLNGFDEAMKPLIVPGDLEKQNISELATYIQTLAQAGAQMFPDRELENHLREAAGLPLAPDDGQDIPDPGAPGVVPGEDSGSTFTQE